MATKKRSDMPYEGTSDDWAEDVSFKSESDALGLQTMFKENEALDPMVTKITKIGRASCRERV